MKKEIVEKQPSLKMKWKYFLVFFLLLMSNLSSLSIFIVNFPPLRYLRQPSLVIALMAVWHYFPIQTKKRGFDLATWLFGFFCLYLTFNTLTSINVSNTATYSAWMLGFYVFFYQFLVLRNELNFMKILYQFALASSIVGTIFILVSYVGGYVFGIEAFFDERYNYSLMRMTTEFSGVFGSNNSLGMITFLTAAFFLFLFELQGSRIVAFIFLLVSVFLTMLLFSIGNRASMACGLATWALYVVWIYRSILSTIFLGTCLFFGFIVFQESILQKLRLEQFEGGNLLGNRSELIDEALAVVEEMNFFGVGYHNQKLSRKYFELVGADEKEYNFHNTYLAIFTELGYFGFLWIPGIILIFLLKGADFKKTPEESRMIRLLKSILVVLLVFYLPVEDSVNSPGSPTFIFFWSMFFILGIGLFEKPLPQPIEQALHEENRISDHTV